MRGRFVFLCNFIEFVKSKRNMGDQLQHYAIAKWLQRHGGGRQVLEVPYFAPIPSLAKTVRTDDVLVMQSSAGMGDLYPYFEEYRLRLCRAFPDHRIVVFPHTVFFQDPANRERSAEEYRRHRGLTLMARDLTSFDTLREMVPDGHVIPVPDVVLGLRGAFPVGAGERRGGGLGIFRSDEEVNQGGQGLVDGVLPDLPRFDLMFPETESCTEMEQPEFVARVFGHIAAHDFVVTDRMHGMIFAAILGVPCVGLAGKPEIGYHKNRATYESWLRRVPYVAFLDNDEIEARLLATVDAVQAARGEPDPGFGVLAVDDPQVRAGLFPERGFDVRDRALINFDFLFHHFLPAELADVVGAPADEPVLAVEGA
jgi:exopolysaccharide biosynthesis predicted pyruvyltransferase EpsI